MSNVILIQIGDRIEFRSPTRWGCRKVSRLVTGFWPANPFNKASEQCPTVRYGGWSNFVVKWSEIVSINNQEL